MGADLDAARLDVMSLVAFFSKFEGFSSVSVSEPFLTSVAELMELRVGGRNFS